MTNQVSRKKTTTPKEVNRIRIAVEHTFGWIDKYRRIILRYDGLVAHFRSFHCLAISKLISTRLNLEFA